MKHAFFVILLMTMQKLTLAQNCDTSSGYVLENESTLAKIGSGPHKGAGTATAHVFFSDVKDLALSFQKHVLHRGSEVGYHKQERDEVYYIMSGYGIITVNNKSFHIKPGDAVLTRKDNFHGMKQEGEENLVFIVSYPK